MDNVRDIKNYLQPNNPNWKNTWIVFVTGIIAFISSLLANLLANNDAQRVSILAKVATGVFSFLALFAVVVIVILFYRSSRYYREEKLSIEEICEVVNNQITKSLKKMLQDYQSRGEQHDIIKQECFYRIDIILEFLERNIYKEIIRYNSDSVYYGRAYSRITPGTMKSIFNSIHTILSFYKADVAADEIDKTSEKYREELLNKNTELCNKLLGINLS